MFDAAPMPDAVLRGLILTPLALLWIVLLVRVVGLRTFSKMTAFDFMVTLASGSLLANAAASTQWTGFVQALVAVAVLLATQAGLEVLRKRSRLSRYALNEPRLLMRDGRIIDTALRETRVARSDVIAKLREANALNPAQVHAVVLETTGDISVLHGDGFDPVVLEGVRGA